MFSVPNPGYKIEKNPIGRQAKSAVRLHGLNNTQYCTGRIRFAARSIPQSPLVPFRLFPQFPTPSVRQNLTTLHYTSTQERRTGRFACLVSSGYELAVFFKRTSI